MLIVGDEPTSGPRPWDVDQIALASAVGARIYTVGRTDAAATTAIAVEHALAYRVPVVLAIPYDVAALEAGPVAKAPEVPRPSHVRVAGGYAQGVLDRIAAYLAGADTTKARSDRARTVERFVVEFGDLDSWLTRSVPERLAAGNQARTFAHFAVVHARAPVEAQYVAAVTSRWGYHVATRDPEQASQFRRQAASLSFDRLEIDKMWSKLAVTTVAGIGRPQIETYRTWLTGRGGYRKNSTISNTTIGIRMCHLAAFFHRIIEWGYPDAPPRPPVFSSDRPVKDKPLPRFLDDAATAKFMAAARGAARPVRSARHRDPGPHRPSQGWSSWV